MHQIKLTLIIVTYPVILTIASGWRKSVLTSHHIVHPCPLLYEFLALILSKYDFTTTSPKHWPYLLITYWFDFTCFQNCKYELKTATMNENFKRTAQNPKKLHVDICAKKKQKLVFSIMNTNNRRNNAILAFKRQFLLLPHIFTIFLYHIFLTDGAIIIPKKAMCYRL